MRKLKISIAALVILFSAFLAHNFVKKNYCLPILMYHSVSPDASKDTLLSVTPATFERQMRFLKDMRYNVIPLESVINFVEGGERIPPRTVVITFDDGYKDNYAYAFPVLKKYAFPASIFIITDEVGRQAGDRLSWDEIIRMRDSGLITFGSHALGPEPLTKIKSDAEVKKQIFESKNILQERLGREVYMFSYPEGRFNDRIKDLVMAAGYKLAVATTPGRSFPNGDIFALKRLRISSNCANMFVFWVETSGIYTFMKEFRSRNKR